MLRFVAEATATISNYCTVLLYALELGAELELDSTGGAFAGCAGVQDAGDHAEAGRGLDREIRAAPAHRPHARSRRLEFRVIEQVEGRCAEMQGHTLGHMESLLQRGIDLIGSGAVRDGVEVGRFAGAERPRVEPVGDVWLAA